MERPRKPAHGLEASVESGRIWLTPASRVGQERAGVLSIESDEETWGEEKKKRGEERERGYSVGRGRDEADAKRDREQGKGRDRGPKDERLEGPSGRRG